MGSGLRAKLNAMKQNPSAPRAPQPPACLTERTYDEAADPRLFALSPKGVERMGFEGGFDPERALFLDTETTGLSGGAGTVVFLLGVGSLEGGRFTVRQYFMPHYGAEPLLMQALLRELSGRDTLVTFNGRTFDVPLLRSRLVMCRMDPAPLDAMRQLDLIHPARRVWKIRVSRCSLSRLEEQVLHQPRAHDLPGSEAPERYFRFLKNQDMGPVEEVIDHNRQDILSLGSLLVRLSEALCAPLAQEDARDVYSVGRVLERRGEGEEARACYRLAARPRPAASIAQLSARRYAGEANWRLSLMLRRGGEAMEAQEIWRQMIERRQMGILPYEELAKHREHREKDYEGALTLTERAMELTRDPEEGERLARRRARLLTKIQTKR